MTFTPPQCLEGVPFEDEDGIERAFDLPWTWSGEIDDIDEKLGLRAIRIWPNDDPDDYWFYWLDRDGIAFVAGP